MSRCRRKVTRSTAPHPILRGRSVGRRPPTPSLSHAAKKTRETVMKGRASGQSRVPVGCRARATLAGRLVDDEARWTGWTRPVRLGRAGPVHPCVSLGIGVAVPWLWTCGILYRFPCAPGRAGFGRWRQTTRQISLIIRQILSDRGPFRHEPWLLTLLNS
jgi:hypothetical protein